MTKILSQKVAVVTGAASGIGLATARLFAQQGASVALIDYHPKELAKAQEEFEKAGYKFLTITCDVSNEEEVKKAIQHIVQTFGRLDIGFNNAGVQAPMMEMAQIEDKEYERIMAINFKGIWNCMKYEILHMKSQGEGAIVNTSSIGGIRGLINSSIYHASKHAVIGLTRSAALDYAASGIRINAICPGVIETPMVAEMQKKETDAMNKLKQNIPINRFGKAEEIAQAVLWLVGPYSSYVIGHALVVDGGITVRF